MRSIVGPLRLDANAKGLALETSFDPRIDVFAKSAAYGAGSKECDVVAEGDGILVGDEMRLKQGEGPFLTFVPSPSPTDYYSEQSSTT